MSEKLDIYKNIIFPENLSCASHVKDVKETFSMYPIQKGYGTTKPARKSGRSWLSLLARPPGVIPQLEETAEINKSGGIAGRRMLPGSARNDRPLHRFAPRQTDGPEWLSRSRSEADKTQPTAHGCNSEPACVGKTSGRLVRFQPPSDQQ